MREATLGDLDLSVPPLREPREDFLDPDLDEAMSKDSVEIGIGAEPALRLLVPPLGFRVERTSCDSSLTGPYG